MIDLRAVLPPGAAHRSSTRCPERRSSNRTGNSEASSCTKYKPAAWAQCRPGRAVAQRSVPGAQAMGSASPSSRRNASQLIRSGCAQSTGGSGCCEAATKAGQSPSSGR